MKKKFKSNVAKIVKETKKTGGGVANIKSILDDNPYNFITDQIAGHNNPYDSDAAQESTSYVTETQINVNKNANQETGDDQSYYVVESLDDDACHSKQEPTEKPTINIVATPNTSAAIVSRMMINQKTPKLHKTDEAFEYADLRKRKLETTVKQSELELLKLQKKKLKMEIDSIENQNEYRKVKMEWYQKDIGLSRSNEVAM